MDWVTEKLLVKKLFSIRYTYSSISSVLRLNDRMAGIGFKIFYPLTTMGKTDEIGIAKMFMKLTLRNGE